MYFGPSFGPSGSRSGRALSLTEIVKRHSDGGYSVVGIADVGKTLYAARVAADYSVRSSASHCHSRIGGCWRVSCRNCSFPGPRRMGRAICMSWPTGLTLLCRTMTGSDMSISLTTLGNGWNTGFFWGRECGSRFRWSGGRVLSPTTMRIENSQGHYRVVREKVSTQ